MWTPSLSKGKPFPVKKMPVEVWAIGDFRFKGIPGISKVNADLHICTYLAHHELESFFVTFLFLLQAQASYTCIVMSWRHHQDTSECSQCIVNILSYACTVLHILSVLFSTPVL